ncbi:dTDP-4-dehydrorhamnose reductase [Marinomonas pollencensis]|uniref:dTDP-4-dehydrorhamnose reductase n=1 Tax=Marinomonas pollencensis TaxID=491954 RepID=A0A3E0D740_9GAMM|nr:dTDP-4-dehydrorhamnose reductase [Marinomonas pollencensis]REG78354.1 dTDP-4-dehydrorhamnose reductase [Marinomonas pollencensis]
MRILLTGKNGQLGRCFQDTLLNCQHELFAFSSTELDITQRDKVFEITRRITPDIIVNAAAYTAVDKAESEPDKAFLVNCTGVKFLSEAASDLGVPLIHISTDYVFDGEAVEPYTLNNTTDPKSIYGKTKLSGEKVIRSMMTDHIILRTSWVFSEYGNNFVKSIVRLGTERNELSVVADQYGCPTYAGDLAEAILNLCEQYEKNGRLEWGTYHYSGDNPTSWHGFARAILVKANRFQLIVNFPKLNVIGSEQYKVAAERPRYSVMDLSAISRINLMPSNWCKALDKVLIKLNE